MALTKDEIKASYPLPAYNFQVVVEGAPDPVRFASVAGLEREHEVLTYRDGLSFLEGERITKYFIDKYRPITLEQGTVSSDTFLLDWLEEKEKRSMEVSLCDETGTPVVTWRIAKAIAVKLTGPRFDAATNDVAIDSLELRAAGISVVHHET